MTGIKVSKMRAATRLNRRWRRFVRAIRFCSGPTGSTSDNESEEEEERKPPPRYPPPPAYEDCLSLEQGGVGEILSIPDDEDEDDDWNNTEAFDQILDAMMEEVLPRPKGADDWVVRCTPYEPSIDIYIKKINSQPDLRFRVPRNWTVDQLKDAIHEAGDMCPSGQRIIFAGGQLSDRRRFDDPMFERCESSLTVHLVYMLRGS
jgi:hypothetical protein